MYASFFGLKETPFNLTPDTRYLFLSHQHRDALNYLLYGIHERKGFIVLTGGIGTGKTTLCRTLLAHFDNRVDTALIFNSFMSELEILETACRDFKVTLNGHRQTTKGYIDALSEFLLTNFTAGRTSVLIIDEAQNLSAAALEQIRMISNLETEREKLIQIVLIGQPELRDLLTSPSLRQLNERITVRYDLTPLDRRDIREYIMHRIQVAGGSDSLTFSNGALKQVFRYSGGIPRRINALCDRAILIAYTRGKTVIRKQTIRAAVRDMQGLETRGPRRKWMAAIAFLAMIVAGVAVSVAYYYHEDLSMLLRTYGVW